MSVEARVALANSPRLIFQRASQKTDILDPLKLRTQMVAMLAHIVAQGWTLYITALVSDHHDDTGICKSGPPYCGTHAHGWAADLWPMKTEAPGTFMSSGEAHFQKFLSQLPAGPYYYQTGLGGSADLAIDEVAAGAEWFPDSPTQDHVHIGCHA